MSACHTKPYVAPGLLIRAEPTSSPLDPARVSALDPRDPAPDLGRDAGDAVTADGEACDYCGSAALEWRKCKLICADCRQINKSCADL